MAKSLSPAKRWRASLRRRARNRPIRSAARTDVSKARAAIAAGVEEEAAVALREAVAVLDSAAQKGAIHPNNAARRKSRLMRQYNAAFAPKPVEVEEMKEEAKEEAPKRRRRAAPKAETAKKSPRATKGTTRARTTKGTTRTRKATSTSKGTTRARKSTKSS